MKVYVVVIGVTETKIKREEYRYASNSIDAVWKHAVQRLHDDPEHTVVEVYEEHPAITILVEER